MTLEETLLQKLAEARPEAAGRHALQLGDELLQRGRIAFAEFHKLLPIGDSAKPRVAPKILLRLFSRRQTTPGKRNLVKIGFFVVY